MANALGTLFGEIAGAIREKTGDTATMKPAQFPEKIAAIEAGGSGGTLVAQYKEFTATSNSDQVVSHNLGTIPVCVCLYPTTFNTSSAVQGELLIALAFSSAVGGLLGYSNYNDNYGRFLYWNATVKVPARGQQRYPIDGTGTSELVFTKATSTNIVIGRPFSQLISGRTYSLWLIGCKTAEQNTVN